MEREMVRKLINAAACDPDKAAALISENAALLNARYIHGETPLHFCAIEKAPKAVMVLARLGFDVNARNEFGDTALIDVTLIGNLEMVKILLGLGADPNTPSETWGCALHIAIKKGYLEIVRELVKSGANPFQDIWDSSILSDMLPSEKQARGVMLEALGIQDPAPLPLPPPPAT